MRWNFGDLPEEFSSFKLSKVLILPLAYEKTASYLKGTKEGPRAIIEASQYMELYDEELDTETYKIGIHPLPQITSEEAPQIMIEKIATKVSQLCRNNKFILSLGGEHSITIGIVKGLKDFYDNLSVLLLDAHADLRNEYEGEKFSHACVARRLNEMLPITIVGVRSLSAEEAEYIKSHPLNIFFAMKMLKREDWQEEIISTLSENVYLSIDLDVFDPSNMPAVGSPEPGGLGWYEILNFVRVLCRQRNIISSDIVELSPHQGVVSSDFAAAKLAYKLLGYIFKGKEAHIQS